MDAGSRNLGAKPIDPLAALRRAPRSLWAAALALAIVFCSATAPAEVCDPKGQVNPAVVQALSLVADRLHVDPPSHWTVSAAHAFAREHMARPAGSERLSEEAKERYQVLFARLSAEDVTELYALLAAAGFVAAVPPAAVAFDYVLLNGSTAPTVRQRIGTFAQAVASGALLLAPTTQVLFLDGERPLFASESPAALVDPSPWQKEPNWLPPKQLPTDERAMNEMLWQQMRLPVALRQRGITFVHAQKRAGAARAETADCVEAWVRRHKPKGGRALVVSNNPFVEYQRRVTQVLLEKSGYGQVEVQGMGPAAELTELEPATRLGVLFDALAGTLYRASQQEALGLFRREPKRTSSARGEGTP